MMIALAQIIQRQSRVFRSTALVMNLSYEENPTDFLQNGDEAKKGKKGEGGGKKRGISEHIERFMETAEKSKRIPLDFTEEEKADHKRIGKEYSLQCRLRHNKLEKDLSTKIWLQQEALRAMPEHLRVLAEIIDETPPPRDRPWPLFVTPPIKGFDPKNFNKKRASTDAGEENKNA